MRNRDAVESFFYFNSPSQLKDWSFLVIEAIILFGAITAVWHALRFRRETGSSAALLTLLMTFLYGLVMDISSYYTVENFWHGEFSVMLLFNRLPLYIALFYPAFIYHAYMTIRRFGLTPLIEATAIGFYSGLMYEIFDNIGPMLNWWIWDRSDPTTWPYLNAVPVTSYHWFFLFTGVLAAVIHKVAWDWNERGLSKTKLTVAVILSPIVTILIGTLLFIPYNLFARSGHLTAAAGFHAILFLAAGLVVLLQIRRPKVDRDTLLLLFPLVFIVGHLLLYVAKFELFFGIDAAGLTRDGLAAANLPAAFFGILASLALTLFANGQATPRQIEEDS